MLGLTPGGWWEPSPATAKSTASSHGGLRPRGYLPKRAGGVVISLLPGGRSSQAAPDRRQRLQGAPHRASSECWAPAAIVPQARGKPRQARDEERMTSAHPPRASPGSRMPSALARGRSLAPRIPSTHSPVLLPWPRLTFSSKRLRFQTVILPKDLKAKGRNLWKYSLGRDGVK